MATRYIQSYEDQAALEADVAELPGVCGIGYDEDQERVVLVDDLGNVTPIGAGGTPATIALAHNKIIIGDSGGAGTAVTPAGDVTIDDTGATAIGADKVTTTMLGAALIGVATASKALVLSAAKAVDTLRATTDLNVGGTGVPGAASVQTQVTKAVTGFADTTAKDVFTVTVPNAAHAAVIEVDCLGVLGAGGAIGAGEATMVSKYQVVLARTAGVNVVATASSAIGGAEAHVAGGDAITSVVVTVSAITGAVGASNTFTIKVAITRSGAGATNHTGLFSARILNQNATGVTIA